MFGKTFYLTIILTASIGGGCQQDNPTRIDSTLQVRGNQNAESRNLSEPRNSMNHNGMNHGAMNHNGMNHSSSPNHSQMNHSMMQTAPNAAAQPFDLQFLDTMIAHHEGAVEMAKPAAEKAANAELKTLAAKIIADQTLEIAEMKKWREAWFAGKPSALNMEMAGMADSMKGMDSAKMATANGAAFDAEFIDQMTVHHQGALLMAREALTKAEHAELKTLANLIIQAQEAEIKQMQNLKAQPAN